MAAHLKVVGVEAPGAAGDLEPSDAQQTRAWLLGLQWPSDVPFLDVLQCCDSLVHIMLMFPHINSKHIFSKTPIECFALSLF